MIVIGRLSNCFENILKAGRRIRARFARKSITLLYHRVAEVEIDPWSMCVTPSNFGEHLEVLQKYYHCIKLEQLAKMRRGSKTPRRAVVVTFDDGYADNLYNAKPLLERYGIPATFFLTSGYTGKERRFWWDELEQLLLRPGTLPKKLNIQGKANAYQWELGEAADYSEEDLRRDCKRRPWESKPGSRISLYHSIWQLLRPLPEEERRIVIHEMLTWANSKTKECSGPRSLSADELFTLKRGELVEIGSHSVTHPLLSAQSIAFQHDEIRQSKIQLEDMVGQQVTSFSYPYGDYTAETVALVREAGFNCACAIAADVVHQHTDLFQLPRFAVENWSGEEFSKRLAGWFEG